MLQLLMKKAIGFLQFYALPSIYYPILLFLKEKSLELYIYKYNIFMIDYN